MSHRDCANGPNEMEKVIITPIVAMTMVAAKQEQQTLDQYAKQPSLSNVHEKKTNVSVCVCLE